MKDKSCSCESCVNACKGHPGLFLPGQAEDSAKTLGIHFKEFKKKLIIDYYCDEDDTKHVYYYRPRKQSDVNSELSSFNAPFLNGNCLFLNSENRCSIDSVKPKECREVMTCENKGGFKFGIVDEWRKSGNPLKEIAESLQ